MSPKATCMVPLSWAVAGAPVKAKATAAAAARQSGFNLGI
jgi:hypothetical protein